MKRSLAILMSAAARLRQGKYAVGVGLLLVVTLFGAAGVRIMQFSHADTGFGPGVGRPFAANSPFNDPIGSKVQIDPNSASMVSKVTSQTPVADTVEFGTPIFYADASTPRYHITCTEPWGTCALQNQTVPIPSGAQSAPGSDGQMVVIDFSAGKSYDFWQYNNNHSTTSWGAVIDINGPGYDTAANSAVGAGISRLAGIVRTYELSSGVIDHALTFSTQSCDSAFRAPAQKSDGSSGGGIPEGARFQLDPSIDVNALPGATPAEKTIARALQVYGIYNVDCGGASMAIGFENPIGKSNPYPSVGLGNDYTALSHIPWNKLRVLKAWNSYTAVSSTPAPTSTPTPTKTPAPTSTPTPTSTPSPTQASGSYISQTGNLATGKTFTSSAGVASGRPVSYINDGDESTRWISTPNDNITVGTDLGAVYALSKVSILWAPDTTKDYAIQVSRDNINWTTVATNTTNNDQHNPQLINTVNFGTTPTGRYIRVLALNRWNNTYGNSIWEIGVYGNQLPTGTTTPTSGPGAKNPDINGDGRINAADMSVLISHNGTNYAAADLNSDGTVGSADLAILLSRWTW